ncbi:hypothetical protein [Scytonema sp. NUACC26]|uniref:hypothetical protein n=1 Tax=Scytonema sp. NUACC26 TaxID=3140176 RepID=UPI0034DC5985
MNEQYRQAIAKLDEMTQLPDGWNKRLDNYRSFTSDEILSAQIMVGEIWRATQYYPHIFTVSDILKDSGGSIIIFLSHFNRTLYVHMPNDYCNKLMYTRDIIGTQFIDEDIVVNMDMIDELLKWLFDVQETTQYTTA